MNQLQTDEIWVFGDLRSSHLLNLSFRVLARAVDLADQTGRRVVLFCLAPAGTDQMSIADGDACTLTDAPLEEAFTWGADAVYRFENDGFRRPTVHGFTDALTPVFAQHTPSLVLFPLTDFGRDLAARTSAAARAGLMADCDRLVPAEDGTVIGLCPSWGGEIMAEITFAPGHATGFATVSPHGPGGHTPIHRQGQIQSLSLPDRGASSRIRLVSTQPLPSAGDDLENAATVVVGGAGMGNMDQFGQVRRLAAAVGGQVAATRPPVLNHWVAEDRLVGQTGRTVRPNLLISVATSGAIQYTAGIMDAGTIVAINRDPAAPIFRLADMGVVADAPAFLPLLTSRIQKAVMRRLADDVCAEITDPAKTNRFGDKVKALREAQGWSQEHLADATGQTPEFIAGVEAGQISPPVAFFLRLSGAYGVDPGTFLHSEEKERIQDQRTQAYVNRTRNYSYQTLTSGDENDHLRAFMVTIEPHHDHKPVAYKHEGEEFIFVMEGELQFTLGSAMHILKRGESIHFHSNTPHKLKSLSADITRCLVILYTL